MWVIKTAGKEKMNPLIEFDKAQEQITGNVQTELNDTDGKIWEETIYVANPEAASKLEKHVGQNLVSVTADKEGFVNHADQRIGYATNSKLKRVIVSAEITR